MESIDISVHQRSPAAIKNIFVSSLFLVAALTTTLPAGAQDAAVDVKAAWARATVPGQKATGAFMTLTAREPLHLVGGTSPAAGILEIHEMKLEGDVMKMRAVAGGLPLPVGKSVELKPGGYHIMLMDLKAPLAKDTRVPISLVLKDAKGIERRLELKLPVASAAPAGGDKGHEAHKH